MLRRPSVTRHLRSIRRALADIENAFASVAKRARKAERVAVRAARRTGRRAMTITPKRRAQLKLQGAYMGYMAGDSLGSSGSVSPARVERRPSSEKGRHSASLAQSSRRR